MCDLDSLVCCFPGPTIRPIGPAWSGRCPVTAEITGSNPVWVAYEWKIENGNLIVGIRRHQKVLTCQTCNSLKLSIDNLISVRYAIWRAAGLRNPVSASSNLARTTLGPDGLDLLMQVDRDVWASE